MTREMSGRSWTEKVFGCVFGRMVLHPYDWMDIIWGKHQHALLGRRWFFDNLLLR